MDVTPISCLIMPYQADLSPPYLNRTRCCQWRWSNLVANIYNGIIVRLNGSSLLPSNLSSITCHPSAFLRPIWTSPTQVITESKIFGCGRYFLSWQTHTFHHMIILRSKIQMPIWLFLWLMHARHFAKSTGQWMIAKEANTSIERPQIRILLAAKHGGAQSYLWCAHPKWKGRLLLFWRRKAVILEQLCKMTNQARYRKLCILAISSNAPSYSFLILKVPRFQAATLLLDKASLVMTAWWIKCHRGPDCSLQSINSSQLWWCLSGTNIGNNFQEKRRRRPCWKRRPEWFGKAST